ncbi:MAG TPA: NAD(P)-dependent oxidoreductase [Gemmatimonadaceae bacterium]|nr:NAD(P)-dependent oxidoreductase [Gemmatimonadaceae bacterium]
MSGSQLSTRNSRLVKVAFLGLGAIGQPMARRIAGAGHQLTVWNRTAKRASEFKRDDTVTVAPTPVDAVREAEVVVTCLSTSADVEAVLNDGVFEAIPHGSTLIDCTSGDPATSRRIAARLAAWNVAFIDAPVSGGVKGAEEGTLTVMCGGDADALDRVRPVIEAFGKKIVHCGPVGAGDAVKAGNQALLALSIWGTGEVLAALTHAGVSPRVALDVINASSGRSNASMNLFPERVLSRAFPRTFRLALLDKDARIAAQIARDEKVPAPLIQLAADLCTLAHAELGEDADHVEAVKVIERWAHTEIQ